MKDIINNYKSKNSINMGINIIKSFTYFWKHKNIFNINLINIHLMVNIILFTDFCQPAWNFTKDIFDLNNMHLLIGKRKIIIEITCKNNYVSNSKSKFFT
jgi:hypothetical protein